MIILGTVCVSVKDTLSIHSRDPEVINEVHDFLSFRIFRVAVPYLMVYSQYHNIKTIL